MANCQPFDECEASTGENHLVPEPRRSTVSLVTAVRAIVTWSPAARSGSRTLDLVARDSGTLLETFQAATAELTDRGLDADSLVRYGMRVEIAVSLLGLLLVRDLRLGTPELVYQRGIDLDGWSKALPNKVETESGSEISADHVASHVAGMGAHIPVLLAWIMRAPLASLVALPVPSHEDLSLAASLLESDDLKLHEQYSWLVDRFSGASLRDWLTSSLLYEYRWKAEMEPPPCPAELMLEKEISGTDLNAEIACRTALNLPDGAPDPEAVLAADMAGHARALLRQGRCGEAAALFEFAARRRPTDPEARNNLGFCLIPSDPRRAIYDLDAAARMGYGHTVVNVYNQVCCHLMLRRPRAALGLAEDYWAAQDDQPGGATLWIWQADRSWEIADSADPHHALAELSVMISQTEGWREAEERWCSRAGSRKNQK
jgi:hypothetical protein